MGKNKCGNSSYLWSYSHFLLFCNHQDTESDPQEIEICVALTIFNQKYIKGSIGKRYPNPGKAEENIVVILHIYGARAIFLLYYYHQDTKFK